VPGALETFGWLACVVYSTIPTLWLLIHSRVEYWRSQRRLPYRVVVPLWIATWGVVGLATYAWRHAAFYRTAWTWLPAVALFALGVWLYREALVNFSQQQLYGLAELRIQNAEQRLVTTGIRAHVRHPVYLGHWCELLAWSIGTGLAVCFVLTAFAMVTGAVMIQMEDRELERRFGDTYRAYRRSVPALLPRLGRAGVRL
jgi:protein-S-isoprenylcysteine O-methyltransferase Ste14